MAPSTELKKNYDLKGKLDVEKWRGNGVGQVSRTSSDKSDQSQPGAPAVSSQEETRVEANGHSEEAEEKAAEPANQEEEAPHPQAPQKDESEAANKDSPAQALDVSHVTEST